MWEDKKKIVLSAAKKMLEHNLVIGSQGNVSIRFRDDRGAEMMAITPSGLDYERLKTDDIVVLDTNGEPIEGAKKPSIESGLHLGIYRKRPDINAVMHSHAVFSSVLAVTGTAIPAILDEQIYCLGGEIRIAKHAKPGTAELARNVVNALGKNNAVIMSHHGALTVGQDMAQALSNHLLLERLAQILTYAILLDRVDKLPG